MMLELLKRIIDEVRVSAIEDVDLTVDEGTWYEVYLCHRALNAEDG